VTHHVSRVIAAFPLRDMANLVRAGSGAEVVVATSMDERHPPQAAIDG
jgi:hypothetical protein